MPGVQTYTLIQERTLTSSAASVSFSSIPQIYEDLVLEIVCTNTSNSDIYLKANSSSTGYSRTLLSGDGSAASSFRNSNQTRWQITYNGYPYESVGYMSTTHLMSYSNPNVFKTILVESGSAASGRDAQVELWQSVSAITSLELTATTNFASGSTFRLYGLVA